MIIDGNLSQTLLRKLSDVVEEQMAQSKTPFLIVSPVIRRKLAKLVRSHLSDLNVLSFTELPETKKVDVIARFLVQMMSKTMNFKGMGHGK